MADTPPPKKLFFSPRRVLRSLMMIDDAPHSIALGTAIGMFIGLTPTVGAQMILVVVFAFLTRRLFRFNQVAALLTVYISNPVTMIPMYVFNYKVGRLFVEGHGDVSKFGKILEYDGLSEWWNAVVGLFVEFGTPLVVGSVVVASIGGALTYPSMMWLLKSVRRANPRNDESPPATTNANDQPE